MEVQSFQTVIIPSGDLAKTIKHPHGLLPAVQQYFLTSLRTQLHWCNPAALLTQPSARLIISAPNCLVPNESSQKNPQEFVSSLVKEDVPRAEHTRQHRISSQGARARRDGQVCRLRSSDVFSTGQFFFQGKCSQGFWGNDPGATVGIPTDSKSCPPGGQEHVGRSWGARAETVTAIWHGPSCPKVTNHPPEAGINPGLQQIATRR